MYEKVSKIAADKSPKHKFTYKRLDKFILSLLIYRTYVNGVFESIQHSFYMRILGHEIELRSSIYGFYSITNTRQ